MSIMTMTGIEYDGIITSFADYGQQRSNGLICIHVLEPWTSANCCKSAIVLY
jgi:hypothetical protein